MERLYTVTVGEGFGFWETNELRERLAAVADAAGYVPGLRPDPGHEHINDVDLEIALIGDDEPGDFLRNRPRAENGFEARWSVLEDRWSDERACSIECTWMTGMHIGQLEASARRRFSLSSQAEAGRLLDQIQKEFTSHLSLLDDVDIETDETDNQPPIEVFLTSEDLGNTETLLGLLVVAAAHDDLTPAEEKLVLACAQLIEEHAAAAEPGKTERWPFLRKVGRTINFVSWVMPRNVMALKEASDMVQQMGWF